MGGDVFGEGLFANENPGPLCSSNLHKGPAWLFVARIFCRRKLAPVRAAKGVTDLRRYPDATRFSSNGYFFFFFVFFAFFAMLPSVTPKLAQCKSTFRHAFIQTTPQLQN
jgi:hypothetical protein